MAIDFRLTARQRELQLRSRKFAKEVLAPAIEAEARTTPEERFAATKPAYEAMIAAGFLWQCLPHSAGGENAGLIDSAIMAEELYAVKRQRDVDVDRNRSRTIAALDRRHK
jgi:nitroalkane oxidase